MRMRVMLRDIVSNKWLTARGVAGLFRRDGRSRSRSTSRADSSHLLRPHVAQACGGACGDCLADYLAPKGSGIKDYGRCVRGHRRIGIDRTSSARARARRLTKRDSPEGAPRPAREACARVPASADAARVLGFAAERAALQQH